MRCDYHAGFRIYDYQQAEGIGTHIDAPCHVVENGISIDQLPLNSLIAPGAMIDISAKVKQNPDCLLQKQDIQDWEKLNQRQLNDLIVLIYTGWDEYWLQESQYRNMDSHGVMHFPGISKAAAHYLSEKKIKGIGIDTLSLDAGISTEYPAHHIFLSQGIYQIENLTNLRNLPAHSFLVIALPTKIFKGPEASARVIALVG
ncbi:MAG: cyclase family protein [Pseudomonadota bacterium]